MDLGDYYPSVADAWRKAGSPRTPRELFKLKSGDLVRLAALAAMDSPPDDEAIAWDADHDGSLLDSEPSLIWALPVWIDVAHVRALLAEGMYAEAKDALITLPNVISDEAAASRCHSAHSEAEQIAGSTLIEGKQFRLEPPVALVDANRTTLGRVITAGAEWRETEAALLVISYWLRVVAEKVGSAVDPYLLGASITECYEYDEVCARSLVEWCEFLTLPDLAARVARVADGSFLNHPPSTWEVGMGLVGSDVESNVKLRALEWLKEFPIGREALSARAVFDPPDGTPGLLSGRSVELHEVPEEAERFLRLLLGLRLTLGQFDEALTELPAELELALVLAGTESAHMAYLAGQIRGAADERRRRNVASPDAILMLEEIRESQKRQEAMTKVGSATSIRTGQELLKLRDEVGALGELVLDDKESRRLLAAQAEEDRRHRDLRDELIRAWQRTVAASEIARTEREAQDLVGDSAWALMTTDTRYEVVGYAASVRNPDDRFAYQAGRSLGYALEGEFKAALIRSGEPPRDVMHKTLGQVVNLAWQSKEASLSAIGRDAANTDPSVVKARDTAAHNPNQFKPDDLKQMAWRLFAGGDPEKGLLARVVMTGRGDAPTGDSG